MNKLIIILVTSLVSFTSYAKSDIALAIDQKIRNTDPSLNIGIKIENLGANKVVYERNADRYYVPASTMKFVSVLPLLEYFGGDYKFTSRLLRKGDDYYIDINDPNFSTKDLTKLISAIDVKKIQGNIHIVDNKFSLPSIKPTIAYSDLQYCYGAPITKVHVNKNCARLVVYPTKPGQKIKYKAGKSFSYVVENNAKTVAKNKLDRLHVSIKGDKYIIEGTLSRRTGAVTISGVVMDNFAHVKHSTKEILKDQGLKLYQLK